MNIINNIHTDTPSHNKPQESMVTDIIMKQTPTPKQIVVASNTCGGRLDIQSAKRNNYNIAPKNINANRQALDDNELKSETDIVTNTQSISNIDEKQMIFTNNNDGRFFCPVMSCSKSVKHGTGWKSLASLETHIISHIIHRSIDDGVLNWWSRKRERNWCSECQKFYAPCSARKHIHGKIKEHSSPPPNDTLCTNQFASTDNTMFVSPSFKGVLQPRIRMNHKCPKHLLHSWG